MSFSTRKHWYFAIILVFLGLIVGLALAEVVVRIVFRNMPEGLFTHRGYFVPSPHPLAVYEPRPLANYNKGFYKFNSYGFRDREYLPTKSPQTYRIAALGDSYTFGQGVSLDNTWVKKLEMYLNETLKTYNVEVLNFGVIAYNTRNELGLLQSKVLKFNPDMLLLGHLINDDFYDLIRIVRGNMVFHYEEDPDEMIPLPVWLKQFLYKHSLLYRYLSTQYLNSHREEIVAVQSKAKQEPKRSWCPPSHERHPIDSDSIREIFRSCSEKGILFVILDFPVTPREGRIREKSDEQKDVSLPLKCLAQDLEVPYLDMFPVILNQDGTTLSVTPQDHHPNAKLCDLYAKYIADRLNSLIQTDAEKLSQK